MRHYTAYPSKFYEEMTRRGLFEVPSDISNVQLAAIARAILANSKLGPIIHEVGRHGDLTESEAEQIAHFVIETMLAMGVAKSDQHELKLSVALARAMADGSVDAADTVAADAFLEGRRMKYSHVLPYKGPGVAIKLSELLVIMQNLFRCPSSSRHTIRCA